MQMRPTMTDPFVLPAGTHIGSIDLDVSDLERSSSFYGEVLGLHMLRQEGSEAVFTTGPGNFPLVTLREKKGARPRPFSTTGLFHIAILFPHREALGTALYRLLQKDYPLRGASHHGVSEAIYLTDPDRNGIELYADVPREEWKWAGDQVSMVTEQLDLEDLLVASPPSAEAPIHPRTTIGHIHLQVSDLRRSAGFYQGLLGFRITQSTYPGALFLAAGEYHHHIGLNTWGGEGAPPPPPESAGLYSFRIVVPGKEPFERLVAHLSARGVQASPVISATSVLEFTLEDPDGMRVVIGMDPGVET